MITALDTETYLIGPVVPAPPLVVGSFARDDGSKGLIPGLDVGEFVRRELDAGNELTGANFVYDTFVIAQEWPELLPTILRAYDAGRLHDVRLSEVLLDIRAGSYRKEEYEDDTGAIAVRSVGYSLAEIAARRLGMRLDKSADSWRLRYNELHAVPLAQWPREAIDYATDDAVATLGVHLDQRRDAACAAYLATVEPDQCRASFALRTIGARGLVVDLDAVDALESRLRAQRDALRPELVASGIYRASGSKNMARLRELVANAYETLGEPVPMTAGGKSKVPQISTATATLKESGNELLQRMAEGARTEKMLTSFIPGMRLGANMPLCVEFEPILETGRTSCRGIKWGKLKGTQTQNLPRSL